MIEFDDMELMQLQFCMQQILPESQLEPLELEL